MLTVAIVGRPNVGKSTLFNRLAGRRLAIVHDTPGVTRDRQETEVEVGPLALRLIDTAGFEKSDAESLPMRMTELTLGAIRDADVCVFVVDAREGVTTGDEIIAQALRRSGKPIVLAANKCEGRVATFGANDAYSLGFGEPIVLSAEHGTGIAELLDALAPFAEERKAPPEQSSEATDDAPKPLKLAIVGRPNVGKSSLFNRLLGEERSLTGPEAGITRDAVVAPWNADGRPILLHDTAGLRKKAKANVEQLERLSVESTLTAIQFAECVIVVMDASNAFEKQDLAIADLVAKEGRAIVFAVNKWDTVENRAGAVGALRDRLDRLLPQVAGAPLVGVSALTGEGLDLLLPAILGADKAWNTHVPTAQLNRYLDEALQRHPTPAIHGRRVRIRYMTQPKTRPPTFALFGNQLEALPDSYLRYLQNTLRGAFDLQGVPIRFSLRSTKNPFAD
ncbi:MAG: ribosome biogenesis GTPase Der [Proteobacteria bacterium]|nr:ribosome biogenesis GTPase Der [Pseudomonadota bacterium]